MTQWDVFCQRNNVPSRYARATPDNICIEDDARGSYKDKCKKLIQHPRSVLLMGNAGTGKTYFMHALLYGLLMHKKIPPGDIRYFRSLDLDARLVNEYSTAKNATYFINDISILPFLFIDDFGLERGTSTAERDYYDLLDRRVSHERITVMSTNLDEKGLRQIYGERISSRLKEFTVVDFQGDDLREGKII